MNLLLHVNYKTVVLLMPFKYKDTTDHTGIVDYEYSWVGRYTDKMLLRLLSCYYL